MEYLSTEYLENYANNSHAGNTTQNGRPARPGALLEAPALPGLLDEQLRLQDEHDSLIQRNRAAGEAPPDRAGLASAVLAFLTRTDTFQAFGCT